MINNSRLPVSDISLISSKEIKELEISLESFINSKFDDLRVICTSFIFKVSIINMHKENNIKKHTKEGRTGYVWFYQETCYKIFDKLSNPPTPMSCGLCFE